MHFLSSAFLVHILYFILYHKLEVIPNVHYLVKSMCTPDHHTHMWTFPKPLSQSWKHKIVFECLYALALCFTFTGTKGHKIVPS